MSQRKATKLARRSLLPGWISLLSWLFLWVSLCWLFLIFLEVPRVRLSGPPISISAFGLTHVGSLFAPQALLIAAVLLLHGVAAYGLLWGRSWGIAAGVTAGAVGLAIALGVLVGSGFSSPRVEPLVQIPLLVSLCRLRERWKRWGGLYLRHLTTD